VPALKIVRRIVKHEKSLNDGSTKESPRRTRGLPSEDGYPTCIKLGKLSVLGVEGGCEPVNQLRNLLYFGGARRATQWYWPPEVGYMEAISEIEEHMASEPKKQKMYPPIRVGPPPLMKPVRKNLMRGTVRRVKRDTRRSTYGKTDSQLLTKGRCMKSAFASHALGTSRLRTHDRSETEQR
jgi:hypothetical protein